MSRTTSPTTTSTTIEFDDGLSVPRLGFGTFQLADQEAYESVSVALAAGYRHVDTAQGYGNEAQVGQAIADSDVDRGEVFVTTKLKPSNAAAGDVHASTEQSLRDLGVDQVDLLLLHWPADDVAPLEETLEAMTQLKDAGKTRAIGVSNFPSAKLARAFDLAPIVTDQMEHHPYLAVEPVEAVLRERGGFLTAYSPLAQGAVAKDTTLQEIGEAHGVTPAQVTLRWQLQKPATVTIPKSGTPERIRSNAEVFDFELSDDEVRRIASLAEGRRLVGATGGPDWD